MATIPFSPFFIKQLSGLSRPSLYLSVLSKYRSAFNLPLQRRPLDSFQLRANLSKTTSVANSFINSGNGGKSPCTVCNKIFPDERALQNHVENSNKHKVKLAAQKTVKPLPECSGQKLTAKVKCVPCNKGFGTIEGLLQHIMNSEKHAKKLGGPYIVEVLENMKSSSGKSQASSIKKSSKKQTEPEKPITIDEFFAQYPNFTYNKTADYRDEFEKLRLHMGWPTLSKNKKAQQNKAWKQLQKGSANLTFGETFGTKRDNPRVWEKICKAVGIEPVPEDLRELLKAVLSKHVSLVDLLALHRLETKEKLESFDSAKELSNYILDPKDKYQRMWWLDREQENEVLRLLLREIESGAEYKGIFKLNEHGELCGDLCEAMKLEYIHGGPKL